MTFNPSNPCNGMVNGWMACPDCQPHVYAFQFLISGEYVVVVTGTPGLPIYNNSGIYAINVNVPDAFGDTSGGKLWNPPYYGIVSPADCGTAGNSATYSTYSFNVSTAGTYDIFIYFYNGTQSSPLTVVAALFAGSYNPGNGTQPYNPCAASGFLQSDQSSASDDRFLILTQKATAGQAFTVVFSGISTKDGGNWGVSVIPTNRGDTLNSTQTYNAPYTPALDVTYTCEAGQLNYYYSYYFVAQYSTYVFDVSSDYDSASALYSGSAAVPPAQCTNFLMDGDTGDTGSIAWGQFNVGSNYTLVIYGYSQGQGTFRLWSLTGPTLVEQNKTGSSPTSVNVSGVLLFFLCFCCHFF